MVLGMVFVLWRVYLGRAPIEFRFPLHGRASWYSRSDPGIRKRTANYESFDDRAMSAAMWGVPFGTKLRVTNKETGQSVVVRVNDRGPHRRYVGEGRVIDLTKAAFRKISPVKKGLINVYIEKI